MSLARGGQGWSLPGGAAPPGKGSGWGGGSRGRGRRPPGLEVRESRAGGVVPAHPPGLDPHPPDMGVCPEHPPWGGPQHPPCTGGGSAPTLGGGNSPPYPLAGVSPEPTLLPPATRWQKFQFLPKKRSWEPPRPLPRGRTPYGVTPPWPPWGLEGGGPPPRVLWVPGLTPGIGGAWGVWGGPSPWSGCCCRCWRSWRARGVKGGLPAGPPGPSGC